MTADDKSFVASTYLKNFYRSHPIKFVPSSLYYRPQSAILERLIRDGSVLVACYPECPAELAGYVLYQETRTALALHWLYVRHSLRRRGVGRTLLDAAAGSHQLLVATHACDDYARLRHRVAPRRLVYDPFWLATEHLS